MTCLPLVPFVHVFDVQRARISVIEPGLITHKLCHLHGIPRHCQAVNRKPLAKPRRRSIASGPGGARGSICTSAINAEKCLTASPCGARGYFEGLRRAVQHERSPLTSESRSRASEATSRFSSPLPASKQSVTSVAGGVRSVAVGLTTWHKKAAVQEHSGGRQHRRSSLGSTRLIARGHKPHHKEGPVTGPSFH